MTHDPLALAQELIRFPSLNPPGDEKACIDFLAHLLSRGGLDVHAYEFAEGRPSLVARIPGMGDLDPLCFTGHVDVVPLGQEVWSVPPFDGVIAGGRLFGRGASDMKAGVAAFVAAVLSEAEAGMRFRRGVTLIITAGEETGCEGAFHLGRLGVLGSAHLLVVAEPSSNRPIVAHKGSMRLVVSASGITAHSSMPDVGDNAIEKAAEWVCRLSRHAFGSAEHPLLGKTTAAVTTIKGGLNINSIPDAASFTVDLRTLPGQSHDALLAQIQELLGPAAAIAKVTDFGGFSTDPRDPALQPLMDILAERQGSRPVVRGAPYFTDASALAPALCNVPAVVIGPGEAEQCHRTDEFCHVERIEEAFDIYRELIRRTCL
ncbi:MAG TPA: M20 family metallopeptidase [Rhizobiaceae bacterium]|nr:M20 family metallopeptidase [Rhizobiaceae bacterium]